MSFTYDISNTSDVSSKLRLELGDTLIDPDGIRPDGRNFSDEELDYFYSEEDSNYWLTVARIYDVLATEWAAYPDSMHLGPEFQKIPASTYFHQKAQAIRTQQVRPGSYSVQKDEIAMDVD